MPFNDDDDDIDQTAHMLDLQIQDLLELGKLVQTMTRGIITEVAKV